MKYAYYPGCTTQSTGTEYGESVEDTSRLLGIDLIQIPDWNCCGATSGHATDRELAIALPSRNLALAEDMSLDMVTPCPACFLRHKTARYELGKDEQLLDRIETDIGMALKLSHKTKHFLEVLYQDVGVDCIESKIQKSLRGLKAVTYYGCYLVRPPNVTEFDNPENPTIMDKIMEALGVEVIDWSCKVDCCGGNLALTNPEIARKLAGRIAISAAEVGADAIITACHMCQYNLDTCQLGRGHPHPIPVFFFSELTALALVSSHVGGWCKKHIVNPSGLLKRLNLL